MLLAGLTNDVVRRRVAAWRAGLATGPDDPWNRAVDADRLAALCPAKAGIAADALVTITAVATRSSDLRDMIISVGYGFNKCRIGI